jgi:hypothetical protein
MNTFDVARSTYIQNTTYTSRFIIWIMQIYISTVQVILNFIFLNLIRMQIYLKRANKMIFYFFFGCFQKFILQITKIRKIVIW